MANLPTEQAIERTGLQAADDTPVFDAAVGADTAALNATVAAFYGTCRSVFTQTFNVDKADITTVEVDFQVAPTVALAAPSAFADHARAFAVEHALEANVEQVIAEMAAGSITASCGTVQCTVDGGTQPVVVTASVSCGAAVDVEPDGNGGYVFTLTLSNLVITVPNEPDYSQMLTALVGPLVLNYLNGVLSNIKIPSLSLLGINFAMPVLTDESGGGDDYLVGYTGLNPVIMPAPGTAWPQGTLFAAVDAAALNAVANKVLPSPSGSGGIDDPLNLSWDYGVNLGASFQPQPGAGASITASLSVNGGAGITWHTPNGLPNISFSASISGSATATAALIAQADGSSQDIKVIIQDVSDIDLHFDFDLPGPIEWILDQLTDALLNEIAPLIMQVLSNFPISVYTLNPISMSFAGLGNYNLVIEQPQLTQIAGPGGLPLVTLTAMAAVQPAQQVSARATSSYRLRTARVAVTAGATNGKP